MRIVKKWPTIDWKAVWPNLVETPSLESDIVHWYKVIHDVIPTNDRLHCIRMSSTDGCNECHKKDTLIHRLTECDEGRDTWALVKSIIAQMLRTIPHLSLSNDYCTPVSAYGRPSDIVQFSGCYRSS